MAIDRNAMKKQLGARLQEQQAMKNRGLNDFLSYFELPEGVSQWSTKPSKEPGTDYAFDIIPFIVGTKYPTNGYGLREGDITYVLDVWVHFNVGPLKKPVVCPLKNYGLPCPICERRGQILDEKGQMDKATYTQFKKTHKELWPSRRVMYNIIDRNVAKGEKDKGIQVYEISHFFSEKKFQERAKQPREGGVISFPDPDEGKTIWVNFKFALDGESWDVSTPQFEDRKYVITDEQIESAVCLDETITVLDYDDILELMQVSPARQEQSEPEEKAVEEAPVVNRRQLSQPPVEEVKTPEGNVNTRTGEVATADTAKTCPIQANFGEDHNAFVECDECGVFDNCAAEKERIEAAKKATAGPTRRRKLSQ